MFALVCGKLDSMLDAGTSPDLVLDLTKTGISSESVKMLSLTLGLPTVSAAFGEEGHIRFAVTFYPWENIILQRMERPDG